MNATVVYSVLIFIQSWIQQYLEVFIIAMPSSAIHLKNCVFIFYSFIIASISSFQIISEVPYPPPFPSFPFHCIGWELILTINVGISETFIILWSSYVWKVVMMMMVLKHNHSPPQHTKIVFQHFQWWPYIFSTLF